MMKPLGIALDDRPQMCGNRSQAKKAGHPASEALSKLGFSNLPGEPAVIQESQESIRLKCGSFNYTGPETG